MYKVEPSTQLHVQTSAAFKVLVNTSQHKNIHHVQEMKVRESVRRSAVTSAGQKKKEEADYTGAVSLINLGCWVLTAETTPAAAGGDFIKCYESTNNKATQPNCNHRSKCADERVPV